MKKKEIEKLESKCGIDTFRVSSKTEPALKDFSPPITNKKCEQNQYYFYIHLDDISDDANDNSITAAAAIENCVTEMQCVDAKIVRVDFKTDFADCDFIALANLNGLLNGILSMIKKSPNVKTTIDNDGTITGFYFTKDNFGTNIYNKEKQQSSKNIKTRVELRIMGKEYKPEENYLAECLLELCQLLVLTTNKNYFNYYVNRKVDFIWDDYIKYAKKANNELMGDYGYRMYYLGKYSYIISCREIVARFLARCGLKDVDSELCKLRKLVQIPEERYTDYKCYVKHLVEKYIEFIKEELKKTGCTTEIFKKLKKAVKPLGIRLDDYF